MGTGFCGGQHIIVEALIQVSTYILSREGGARATEGQSPIVPSMVLEPKTSQQTPPPNGPQNLPMAPLQEASL